METVIAALISAGVTLVICLITQAAQNSRTRAVIEYRLDELTKQVEKHNNLIERMVKVETKLGINERGTK